MKEQKPSPDLIKLLACPLCKESVKYDNAKNIIICKKCKEVYPVKEGIPVMLPKE